MRKIFYLICFTLSIFAFNVSASNDISYSINITKDYDFKEVINYSLTDYKVINNGYNYFSTIVNDDVYTDIFYNTKYNKTKRKSGNVYRVKLSHTYNEYTMSNANFLNNCFEKSSYDYDMDKIKFSGKGGFLCFRGDSLKITLNTDFSISNTNALKNGNTYTWNPSSENFEMYFTLYKTYPESTPKESDDVGVIHADNPGETGDTGNTDTVDTSDGKEKSKKSPISIVITVVILGASFAILFVVFKNLKNKKDKLNQI